MVTRLTDAFFNASEGGDFIIRDRKALAIRIFAAFAIAFVAIYLTAVIMNELGNKIVFLVSLTLIIGLLGGITLVSASQHRDLVMVTEFQNALLASAAHMSTRFCVITKRDGSVAYIDPNFSKMFPQMMRSDVSTISGLLASASVPDDLLKKIGEALQKNQGDRTISTLTDANGSVMPIMVTIDPLPRPAGYYLIRGRDYVEKRASEKTNPETTTSARLLSQALDVLPEGVLIASSSGTITYVNHILEEWLGYKAGEICAASLKLPQLVHQYGSDKVGEMRNEDFDGEVKLQHKNRTLVTLEAYQTLLRENGKTLGLSMVLSTLEPSDIGHSK